MPILRVDEGFADRTALATWHEALSDSLAVDVPHDLLGLWLHPVDGGTVLLGPEALAQDSLAVPTPSPQFQPHQLAALEAVIRDAGYRSVVGLPIRFGRRDVGLMLVADLRPDRYGGSELLVLRLVAQRLAPMLGRLARQWSAGSGDAVPQVERIVRLLDAVAESNGATSTPQRFLAALSPALEPLLPHDHLELLLGDPAGTRYYRLGEHMGGALWLDPSLTISSEHLDVDALFGTQDTLRLADACRDSRWPRGYFTVAEPAGAECRAVIGARIPGRGKGRAYLLVASVGVDLYGEEDAALLGRLAAFIGPQVSLLMAGDGTCPSPVAPGTTTQLAALLATCGSLSEAGGRIRDIAATLIPFDEMRYAIRLSEGDRVVLVEPGEPRPLPDLPLVPVAGTALGQVLAGEATHSLTVADGEARLVVPLRVAGRVHGVLMLSARNPSAFGGSQVQQAQELADVLAPHFELLRRSALLPPPYLPGWKRTHRN